MDRQQFGLAEKMEAEGPFPEARSAASHASPSRLISAVRLALAGERRMTTVTLPSLSAAADSTCCALVVLASGRGHVFQTELTGEVA